MMQAKAADPVLARLAGRWTTSGRMHADGRTFSGNDRYQAVSAGHFLLHSWEVDMPDGPTTGIEVIGPGNEAGYVAHVFDDQGGATTQSLRVDGDDLEIESSRLRFRGSFCDDGLAITGTWESRGDGDASTWEPLMDVRLEKVE